MYNNVGAVDTLFRLYRSIRDQSSDLTCCNNNRTGLAGSMIIISARVKYQMLCVDYTISNGHVKSLPSVLNQFLQSHLLIAPLHRVLYLITSDRHLTSSLYIQDRGARKKEVVYCMACETCSVSSPHGDSEK